MSSIAVASTETVAEPDGQVVTYFDLPSDEVTLLRLFRVLFEEHPGEIVFGPCIQGAVFEIHVEKPAQLTVLDGYLTVDFGAWHFHLCIGEHRARTPELAQHRRVKRASLFRSRNKSCVPASWGLRLWNGHDEQMITVFFPNPYLDAAMQRPGKPDWARLQLWDQVRHEFLSQGPDPLDRTLGEAE